MSRASFYPQPLIQLDTRYIKVAGGNSAANIIIENDYQDGDITFKVNDGGVDTTVMTIDGATGRVGIGTTGPGAKLEIGSLGVTSSDYGLYINTGNASNMDAKAIYLKNSSTSGAADGYLAYLEATSEASNVTPLYVSKTGTSKDAITVAAGNLTISGGSLKVDGSGDSYFTGNVGIGTTSPGTLFHVSGNTSTFHGNGNAPIVWGGTSTIGMLTYNGSNAWVAGYGGDLILAAGGANEYMRIKNTGNVGIGTTGPSQKLEVAGNIRLSGSNSYVYVKPTAGLAYIILDSGATSNAYISLREDGTHKWGLGNVASDDSFRLTVGDLNAPTLTAVTVDTNGKVGIGTTGPLGRFEVNDGSNTDFIVESAGNGYVGIGLADPAAKLHIAESWAQTSLILEADDGYSSKRVYGFYFLNDATNSQTNLALGKYTNAGALSGNLVTITNAGNVGIGTVSPGAKLEALSTTANSAAIVNSLSLASGEWLGYGFRGYTGASGAAKSAIGHIRTATYGVGDLIFLLDNTADTSNADLSDERVRITSTGNVGIGTTNPGAKLDVNGSIKLSGTDNIILNGNWLSGDGGDEGVFVSTAGNVGIGTTNPSAGLHVSGTGSSSYIYVTRTSGANTVVLSLDDSGYVGTGTDHDFGIYTNNTARVWIENTGNVGIGTTGPGTVLHVSNNDPTLRLQDANDTTAIQSKVEFYGSAAEQGFVGYYYDTEARFGVWQKANKPLTFATNDSERVRITNTGNVGIGTTGPDRKLEINTGAATGGLRLTYNDSNGSAATYADFLIDSAGDLAITATGGDISFNDETLTTTGLITGGGFAVGANVGVDATFSILDGDGVTSHDFVFEKGILTSYSTS